MKSKIKLESLTPIHIGSGSKYGPLEYYIKNNKLVRVDFYRICSDPSFKKYNERVIRAALDNRKEFISNLVPDLAESHTLYSLDSKLGSIEGLEIREQIKTNLRPYIPGSSLKGSILTAMAYDYFKSHQEELEKLIKRFTEIRHEQNVRRKRKEIAALGRYIIETTIDGSAGNNKGGRGSAQSEKGFARWLRISDPIPAPIESLFAGKISTYPRGPPIAMEMLKPGVTFEYEFEPIENIDLDKMLGKVNAFYSQVLKKENEWRGRLGLRKLEFGGNGTLIRVGMGSSKVATSLMLLLNEGEPRTRKLVEPEKQPMGWASLCKT